MKSLIVFLLCMQVSWAGEPGKRASFQERVDSEFGIFENPEIGNCKYELIGTELPVELIYEDEKMDFEKCKERGRKTLYKDKRGFTKVLIKHQSRDKWIVVEKE